MQQSVLHEHLQPQYDLFIRRSDNAMKLVEQRSRRPVAIEKVLGSLKESKGLFVLLRDRRRVSVFLMGDEIHYCDVFPEREGVG